MSGIEVVGLVLAVIPLFISAAEHYRDVKDTAHRFVDKDLLLQMYREDLISQQAYLILNLRSLLVDVDLDDADKDALLGHLSSESGDNKPALSDLWEQSQMREELIDRFGVGYKPFVILMQRLSKTLMSQIKKHDLLQDHGSINDAAPADCSRRLRAFHDKLKLKSGMLDSRALWGRVRFTWQNPERNEMLRDIRRYNEELQKLFYLMKNAKPFYSEQRSHRAWAVFRVRDKAQHLHHVLSKYCQCRCTPAHQAKLCLRRLYCEVDPADDACFETVLYQSPSSPCQATVRIVQSIADPSRKHKVSFNVNNGQRKALDNICLRIGRVQKTCNHLELVIDEQGKLWETDTCNEELTEEPRKTYTLDSLLLAFSEYPRNRRARWLDKEKAMLTVILSHSLLQLDGSQWLKRDWRTEQISFFQDEEISIAKNTRFKLDHPYVSAEIMAPRGPPKKRGGPFPKSRGHPIPSLLALGVILIELHLNGPIETAGVPNPMDDLQFWAMAILRDCRDEMEPFYHDVITFCLWPPGGECAFENSSFRDDYYQKVVVPLEDELTGRFEFSKKDLAKL